MFFSIRKEKNPLLLLFRVKHVFLMTLGQTSFLYILLCMGIVVTLGYGEPQGNTEPQTEAEEAKPSKHKFIKRALPSGRINPARLYTLLHEHVGDDKALRQNLEGGVPDWDIFKIFIPRLVSIPFFVFYNPLFLFHVSLITVGTGVFRSLCALIDVFLETSNALMVQNVLCFSVTNYYVFYALCSLCFFLYNVWHACKRPNYLMLVMQSKSLSKEEKEALCDVLISVMVEEGLDLTKTGLVIEQHASHVVFPDEVMDMLHRKLRHASGQVWMYYFLFYCEALLRNYGASRACLTVKSVTILHLAYEHGLEKTIDRLETIIPECTNIEGYSFQDGSLVPTAEELYVLQKNRKPLSPAILPPLFSMFKLNVPYPSWWEFKKPAAFAPKSSGIVENE